MARLPIQRRIRLAHGTLLAFLAMVPFAAAQAQPAQPPARKPANTAPSVPAPGGWHVVKDHGNQCQMSVPGDWAPVAGFGMASSAKLHARAAVQADSESSWNELKKTARDVLKPGKIVEDTSSRFSFVYATGNGKGFYTARSFAGYSCIAQVDFDDKETGEKNSATATQMAGSVDKAH
jgi:hypothetical protein